MAVDEAENSILLAKINETEQQRRDFKAANPKLYAYIRHVEAAKTLDSAGDVVSGFTDCHAAANSLWSSAAQRDRRIEELHRD